MPRQRKQPVEVTCANCGQPFKTRYEHKAKYCSSRCRSEVWNREHRIEDPEKYARDVLRAHWRAEWKRNGPARRARRRASKKAVA